MPKLHFGLKRKVLLCTVMITMLLHYVDFALPKVQTLVSQTRYEARLINLYQPQVDEKLRFRPMQPSSL